MIRLYGRSIRGKRCFDKTPHKWKTITMLSSIRSDGHTESIIFKGALNKKIFELYVEKVLAPSLRPGDIVVMDTECAQIAESGRDYQFLSCSYMIFAIFGVAAPCFFDVKMCSRVCVGWGVSLSCVGLGPVVQTDTSVPQQDTNSAG